MSLEDLHLKGQAAIEDIVQEIAGDKPINQANASEPSPLTPREQGAMIAVSRILDLRTSMEVYRFLRCLQGVITKTGRDRLELMIDMCEGRLCLTNAWVEDGHLEVRTYIPAELETPERRRRFQRVL